jgi:hypothetical protein
MYDDVCYLLPTLRSDLPFTDAQIRSAVRRRKMLALRRGVLVGRKTWDEADDRGRHLLLAKAAILATSGAPAAACLGSAAIAHRFDRLGQPAKRVRLYRASGGPWRDDDIAVLTCGLPSDHLTEVDGLRVTTGARTAVDLARWVSFRGGVVVADSALRHGVRRDDMEQVVRDCVRWPGIRRAREVVAFADGNAANPLESISRVLFREWGLPAPQTQVTVLRDEFGNPVYIVDFLWEELGVVGEADGLLKYDGDPEGLSLRREKLRQEALEDMGYVVIRWTWSDIWQRPEWVNARLRGAFARAGQRRRTAS